MARREFDAIKVKDQLGKPDNIGIFGPFKKTETLIAEEQPTVVVHYDLSSNFARWDDPETTWDGTDDNDKWVDYGNPDIESIVRINNFNDEFIWRFTHSDLRDADNQLQGLSFTDSDVTTATEDIDNQEVTFTAGQVWQSKSAFKDSSESQVVSSATLSVTSTSGVFLYELSANGGTNWETVSNNVPHIFTHSGSDLRIRVTEDDSSTGTITVVRCAYNI
jgi:hypothetical protein